jgi:hypothetical protein
MQVILSYYKRNGDLGGEAMGMAGTATPHGKAKVFAALRKYISRGYEFVDMGAGSGVMLFLALCEGAELAVGVEVRSAGYDSVFNGALKLLSQRVSPTTIRLDLGCGVGVPTRIECMYRVIDKLPTLQQGGQDLPVVVFAFSEGFNEMDRRHLYQLVGQDRRVRLFICSKGAGSKDKYRKAGVILKELNEAADEAGLPHFSLPEAKLDQVLKVSMVGSGSQKSLLVLLRCP